MCIHTTPHACKHTVPLPGTRPTLRSRPLLAAALGTHAPLSSSREGQPPHGCSPQLQASAEIRGPGDLHGSTCWTQASGLEEDQPDGSPVWQRNTPCLPGSGHHPVRALHVSHGLATSFITILTAVGDGCHMQMNPPPPGLFADLGRGLGEPWQLPHTAGGPESVTWAMQTD